MTAVQNLPMQEINRLLKTQHPNIPRFKALQPVSISYVAYLKTMDCIVMSNVSAYCSCE